MLVVTGGDGVHSPSSPEAKSRTWRGCLLLIPTAAEIVEDFSSSHLKIIFYNSSSSMDLSMIYLAHPPPPRFVFPIIIYFQQRTDRRFI